MKIEKVTLAYFSPTGTTKAVAKGISRGINHHSVECVDITKPDARKQPLRTSKDQLLVIASPVYMGRVPSLLMKWFQAIEAKNTPVACIVVYGNRVYDNALLELRDLVAGRGCRPIACAAFIGEHSFSSPELPTAQGRPDAKDLSHAELFGKKIRGKLRCSSSAGHISEPRIPGDYPYGGITELWDVDFIAVGDGCVQCGICAEVCPVGAIDPENSAVIDVQRCITCCACIKSCPQNARTMKTGPVRDAAIRLNTLYKERKEPLFFI